MFPDERRTTRVQIVKSYVPGRVIYDFGRKLSEKLSLSFANGSGRENRTKVDRHPFPLRWRVANDVMPGGACGLGEGTGETTNSLRVEIQLTF